MATHIKVDVELLRQTGTQLGEIAGALKSASARVREDRGVLGHGGLSSAMEHFVDNWRVHRERLVSAVEAHQKMATQSADAYQQTERNLAAALDPGPAPDPGQPGSPGGGHR